MAVEVPKFPAHFKFTGTGVQTVEQDGPEDVAACVYRTAVCPVGWREDLPEFGIRSPLFQTIPLSLDVLREEISRWEPRASLLTTEEEEHLRAAWRQVTMEVGV